MTFRSSRFPIFLTALGLLAGCAGSSPRDQTAVYAIPSSTPPAYSPPVSESYIIDRAPQPPMATPVPAAPPVDTAEFAPVSPQQTDAFEDTELLEIVAAENARREAEARRSALAELLARIETVRAENLRRGGNAARAAYEGGFAPFEAASASERLPDGPDAAELAAAKAAAAEAESVAIAAEAEARRALREQAAETAARQADSRQARANPPQQRRPIFGSFATRPPSAPAAQETRTAEIAPAPRRTVPQPPAPRSADIPPRPAPARQQVAALAPPAARPAPAPRPTVERSPIPGLKPYILARTPSPTAKPRRAKPQRSFDVQQAAVLPGSTIASITPPDVTIPREPGADLGARFFPTPGKPSTLGTDRDTSLDLASIDATPYGIGSAVRKAVDGASTEWADAVRLIENGEVEALAILEDADLELTLCSGRSILTTPPDLSAAATLTAPQIICGQNKPLALR